MGLASAALGIFALLIGAFFFPIPLSTTADAVAVAVLVRGTLALSALGITLGLAYYAGLRVERDRLRSLPAAQTTDSQPATAQDRFGSLIAGLLVTFCWWFGTTLTGYLMPLLPETASSAADPSQFEQRLVWGALIAIIGMGLGGLGSRTLAARALLERIVASPSATTVPLTSTSTLRDSVQVQHQAISSDGSDSNTGPAE